MSSTVLKYTPEEWEKEKERQKWLAQHPFTKKWHETCSNVTNPLFEKPKFAEILNDKDMEKTQEENIKEWQEKMKKREEYWKKHPPGTPLTEEQDKTISDMFKEKDITEISKRVDKLSKNYVPKEDVDTGYKVNDTKLIETIRELKNTKLNCTFETIAQEIVDLHEKKNHDYGDAAYQSYLDFGLVSYVIRLGDKFNRLKSLTKPGANAMVKEESIIDTLKDLAAYSIMAIEALRKENTKNEE